MALGERAKFETLFIEGYTTFAGEGGLAEGQYLLPVTRDKAQLGLAERWPAAARRGWPMF